MPTKYIFVTGGVLSGLGKGIAAASIGNLLKSHGYKVVLQKFDPYLNTDAGTLNPAEHGECFVTADGAETDLDLGHYERFLDTELTHDSSVMSGAIYQAVIEKERQGKYLGKTVQVIPHITDEVKLRLYRAGESNQADIVITEIGGTIGDIESTHFVEAARQVMLEQNGNSLSIHLGYLPYLATSEELKTKPIQNSINDLRSRGIQPGLILCRADYPISKSQLEKIALFSGLKPETIIPLPTASSIYAVPGSLRRWNVDELVLSRLGLKLSKQRNNDWEKLIRRIERKCAKTIRIGLVGKYMTMADTYFSVNEALRAAGWETSHRVEIVPVESEAVEISGPSMLAELDGIIVPGGFGTRGTEGAITAIQFARENNIPLLGICLGMQLACVEYARHVLNLPDAHSVEFSSKGAHVIALMPDQTQKLLHNHYGGSMRLGNYRCHLQEKTRSAKLYRELKIDERHRHRYEFNNEFRPLFEVDPDFVIAGTHPETDLVELIELKNHPYFIACQFHPEFKSRPNRPHPLFKGLIKAAIATKRLAEGLSEAKPTIQRSQALKVTPTKRVASPKRSSLVR